MGSHLGSTEKLTEGVVTEEKVREMVRDMLTRWEKKGGVDAEFVEKRVHTILT